MNKLALDKKTYISEYAGEGDRNYTMEVEAVSLGLRIDGDVTVPWNWIVLHIPKNLFMDRKASLSGKHAS